MTVLQKPPAFTEEQLDTVAGLILIGGSSLSFVIMIAGFILLVGKPLPSRALAQPVPEVLAGSARLEPLALINLGILVLMATPVLRVIIAIVGFALERRWRFVGVSGLVFAMLMISFAVASR